MWEQRTLWSFEPVLRELTALARILRRRWWPFATAAAVPVIATAIYVLKAPNRYEATARVIIGRDESALEFGPAFMPRSNELKNQVEMMESHEVVAKAVAAGRRLYPPHPPGADEIRAALKVKALQDTDIIEITTEAGSCERAAALANLVADAYIDAHLRDKRKSAAREKEFVEGQLVSYERRLKTSEQKLEDYKRAAGVASLEAETTELIKSEAGFVGELEKARVDLAVAESRRTYYEHELRATEERLLAEAGAVSSPVARQLQEKLITLEYRYANLILKGYDPGHRELVALAAEIDLAKQKLAEAAAGIAGEEHNVNLFAKMEQLVQELDAARAEVAALRTRERELADTVAFTETHLATLPEKESTLARLVREKDANESIYMLLLEKREEARIAEASEVGTARVFSWAVAPDKPFAPRRKQSLLLGILSGLLFGVAAVAIVEYFDRTVKSPAAAQQVVGAAVLGVIPHVGRRSRYQYPSPKTGKTRQAIQPARIAVEAPKSPPAEAFRRLYAQLAHLFANDGAGEGVVLGVTSSRAQEGKSTVAFNLAVNFAQLGTRTVLVDADLDHSTVAKFAGLTGGLGVANFLRGEESWDGVVNWSEVEGLAIVTAGTNPSAPPALLASYRFETLVTAARQGFGVTIVDVPPVFPVADVALVARTIKKFLLVIRAGVIGYQELDSAVRTLKQVGGEVLGVVLNCAELGETYGYGYYHYDYYYKREGGGEGIIGNGRNI